MQTLAQLRSGGFKGAVSLKLSERLAHFPREIFELADTLEVLDLSQNELKELPADFGKLKKLKTLFCSDNLFPVFPEVLGDCPSLDIVGFKANRIETIEARSLNPNLRWLILTNNSITELPKEIGLCSRMQKLMLAGNELSELPEELGNCCNLSLLRISANQLKELPDWLLAMPKLSWLAFSGNRFSITADAAALPFIRWQELAIHHVLGEGASGIIFKGVKYGGGGNKEVAVKIFKGAVTSDGLPSDEMSTFIAAGIHPGLVQLIGQIAEHPEEKKGLVMELIPERFYNLGLPPTFDTCTRDVFKDSISLSVAQVVKIAATIASVAGQLHSRGIMHGDLYAHNTLIDDEGNTLLSDFGAAAFYDKTNATIAAALERIEVSAFGYMLDDLLSLCNEPGNTTLIKINALRDACLLPDVLSRPCFQYLNSELVILT
ncbi:MAG: protein kinase [Flavipsychrobacter sp.]|nr:protein kinase [Flavipsychrobacter sp.]